jgi:hypothetical protein
MPRGQRALAGQSLNLRVEPVDRFKNVLGRAYIVKTFGFLLQDSVANTIGYGAISPQGILGWGAAVPVALVGDLILDVTYNGTSIMTQLAPPLTLSVAPGAVSATTSTLSPISGTSTTIEAGTSVVISMQARDSYGNSIKQGGLGNRIRVTNTRLVNGSVVSLAGDTASIIDHSDEDTASAGSYSIVFTSSVADGVMGPAMVVVSVDGAQVGNLSISVLPSPLSVDGALSTRMDMNGVTTTVAGKVHSLRIHTRDQYGNARNSSVESARILQRFAVRIRTLCPTTNQYVEAVTGNISVGSAVRPGSLDVTWTLQSWSIPSSHYI